MPKYLDDFNRIIDSSSVAVLSGLSRVLFMQANDYKARITTFIASVCFGLVTGIVTGNIESLNGWRDIIVAIAALAAKEIIEYLSAKMKDPLRFYSDIRNIKNNDKSTDEPKSD
jgi:hypothetical protein